MKTDSAKGERFRGWQPDVELRGGSQAIRQQAFTAGFVDAGLAAIGQRDCEALAARCNRCRQAHRSTAYHKNVAVRLFCHRKRMDRVRLIYFRRFIAIKGIAREFIGEQAVRFFASLTNGMCVSHAAK
jgi:hypothetical protein